MDCKLARAAGRQRKINLNQLERKRHTQGAVNTPTHYHHHPSTMTMRSTGGNRTKIHSHQRAIKIYERSQTEDEEEVEEEERMKRLNSEEDHQSTRSKIGLLSLADVMIERPKKKQDRDCFEFIEQPIRRIIVLPEEEEEDENSSDGDLQQHFPILKTTTKTNNKKYDVHNIQNQQIKEEEEEEGWDTLNEIKPTHQSKIITPKSIINQNLNHCIKNQSWSDVILSNKELK